MTILSNAAESLMLASKIDCTFLLIVPSSVSPIFAVAATVRNPSGPRNTKSPANSCMVSPLIQPIRLVTGVIENVVEPTPVSLNILFSQNINKLSRKTLRPVIVSSTFIVPAGCAALALKPSSLKPSLNHNSCGVVDLPA